MNLRMAVSTGMVDEIKVIGSLRGGGMPGFNMAPLTDPAHFGKQHLVMVRAVGVMTIQTILRHRRMRPQKRASFFSVTFIAGFID